MTKRERDAIVRKFETLTVKVGKKRDELRVLLADLSSLYSSVEEADDELHFALQHLKDARDSFEVVTDKLSQFA